jgi:hypothetical protein
MDVLSQTKKTYIDLEKGLRSYEHSNNSKKKKSVNGPTALMG